MDAGEPQPARRQQCDREGDRAGKTPERPRGTRRGAHHRVERQERADPECGTDAVQEHRGRVDDPRRGGTGVPAECERKSQPEQANKREAAGGAGRLRGQGEEAGKERKSGCNRGETVGGRNARFPSRLLLQRGERKIERVEALQTDRRHVGNEPANERHDPRSGTRWRIGEPGAKECAARADEQSNVDDDLDHPQTGADAWIAKYLRCGRRSRARSADRKDQGSRDRVAIGRDHAPAQHMRAAAQVLRQVDCDLCVLRNYGAKRDRLAVGADEADHERRHRLVERQGHCRGRTRQHGSVGGLRLEQRSMRPGLRRLRECRQQRDDKREAAHGRGRVTSWATVSAPGRARDNRWTIFPRQESRSSDEYPSRIPALPGNRASFQVRDRRQRIR